MGFFRRAKDRLIERAAPGVLNATLMAELGTITAIELDSAERKLHVEALLRGEREPIRVEIGAYEITRRDGVAFFTIKQIETSREWITTVARQQLVNRAIELPKELGGWVGRLL
jgi:hypothetical protein